MKRTEALSIIESALGIPYSEGGDYYSEKILAALEEAGMQPPSRGYRVCHTGGDLIEDTTWENE